MSDQPDFDHLDVGCDQFLPLLQGAHDGLLAALAAVPESGRVLDLACGVGEPTVTLARRRPDLRLTGIDISETQIGAARARAAQLGNDGVRFEVMSMDALEQDTGSVDAVMSRMGALMMGDPIRTAREAARVLAPGGRLAVAVWGTLDMHAAMRLGLRCLGAVLPAEHVPDLSVFDKLAAAGVRDGILREAGLTAVESRALRWTFERADFESWWSFVLAGLGQVRAGQGVDLRCPEMSRGLGITWREYRGARQKDWDDREIPTRVGNSKLGWSTSPAVTTSESARRRPRPEDRCHQ